MTLVVDGHDLVEESLAGIFALALGVDRVSPVLADREDRVDGKCVSAATEGFGDRGIDRDLVFLGDGAGHLILGELVHVHRDDLHAGGRLLAVEEIGLEKVLHDDMGMAAIGKLGEDGRHLDLGGIIGRGRLEPPGGSRHAEPRGPEKLAPVPGEMGLIVRHSTTLSYVKI